MNAITVYDPPMCCSTGICGTDIDQRLIDFAADLDWLKGLGVAVRRINLGKEPGEFLSNPKIATLLQQSGGDDLPAVMVGGAIVAQGRYPGRTELAAWAGVSVSGQAAPRVASSGCCGGAAKETGPAQAATTCCGGGEPSRQSGCC